MAHNQFSIHDFAFLITGDRIDAERHVDELLATTAEKDEQALIGALARQLQEALGRKADVSFRILDNILRSDITRPVDMRGAAVRNSPERIRVLLWELKRTCLARVLGCLPPSVRLSFVLTEIFGYPPNEAATMLEIRESAYRVRLTRARKRVDDYLTPRCQFVDAKNPCTCEGRLGIALDARFVEYPPHEGDTPVGPHDASPPCRDTTLIYRGLPRVSRAVHLDRLM